MNCDATMQSIEGYSNYTQVKTATSAAFALELVAGAQKVRFTNLQNQ